jgi:hypothetical protein
MDEIIVAAAIGLLVLILLGAAVAAVWSQNLSDEERERWGLGPKGQGR